MEIRITEHQGSRGGYPFWYLRVVQCSENQQGWASEKNVRILATSQRYTYRSNRPNSVRSREMRRMEQYAQEARRNLNVNLKPEVKK